MGVKKVTSILLAFIFMTTGCNELGGFEVAGSKLSDEGDNSSNGSSEPVVEEVDMQALDKDLDAMEGTLAEVEKEIAKIDLPFLMSGSSASGQQGLDKNLRALFTKLYGAVELVYNRVGDIRTKVNEQLAKLDPSNPLHFAALMKLREYMRYIDDLEARVSEVVLKLADKVTDLVAKLEGKIAEMDQSSPLTWAVMFFWQQIKTVLIEFHDKLVALAAT